MPVTRRLRIVDDPRYQAHQGPPNHPEKPERLVAVASAFEAFGPRLDRMAPRSAQIDEILHSLPIWNLGYDYMVDMEWTILRSY